MLDKALSEYIDRFGDGFPMFQIGRGKPDEQIIEIINTCIRKGKDAYELGLATLDEDVYY